MSMDYLPLHGLPTLTVLSRFYPVPSEALVRSPMFQFVRDEDSVDDDDFCEFAEDVFDLIFLAQKLRHPVLFWERLVHIVGNPRDTEGDSPRIQESPDTSRIVSKAHNISCQLLLKVQQSVIHVLLKPRFRDELTKVAMYNAMEPQGSPLRNALLYRRLKQGVETHGSHFAEHLVPEAEALLKNNLVLDRTGDDAGEGYHVEYFLCADLEYEDMSRDDTETGW